MTPILFIIVPVTVVVLAIVLPLVFVGHSSKNTMKSNSLLLSKRSSNITTSNSYKIFPIYDKEIRDYDQRYILVFLVGTALPLDSYNDIFTQLTIRSNNIIIYVLDSNPGNPFKTLDGFLKQVNNIDNHIKLYYNIPETSGEYYFGGHSVGGIIALNAVYPSNTDSNIKPNQSIQINDININFPYIKIFHGFICFDPVDGTNKNAYVYGMSQKYDPSKRNTYVLYTNPDDNNNANEIIYNPYSMLIYASAKSNTGVDPIYGGQRAYHTLSYTTTTTTNNDNYADIVYNKHCYVSADLYHHMDYVDPDTCITLVPAYKLDSSRLLYSIDRQRSYILPFQTFVIDAVCRFLEGKVLINGGLNGDMNLIGVGAATSTGAGTSTSGRVRQREPVLAM